MIKLLNGDCLDKMKHIESDSVDLIFTSPPYANQRISCYEGVHSDEYVNWFIPIATEFFRILKPTGSLFINIKPHTESGERVLYVWDLIKALKYELGFVFIDELCWIKNAYPGQYHGRFKNGFEPIYHLSKGLTTDILFNPLACGTKPIYKEHRRKKQFRIPENGSGLSMKSSYLNQPELARPSNVIKINNVVTQHDERKKHPAVFPVELADFFIKSYSNENSLVLDPFMGSGSTGISAKKLNRNFIGIELDLEYFNLAKSTIQKQIVEKSTSNTILNYTSK